MIISAGRAALLTFVMGAVILACRILPFLLFRDRDDDEKTGAAPRLLTLAEKTVPPIAMTVLAGNALSGAVKANPPEALPVLAAAALTALLHLWKRNVLLSIASGTALYMVLGRLF